MNINPNKGIFIISSFSCGKTTLMKLLPYMVPYQRNYEIIPVRNMVFMFNNLGFNVIEQYGNNKYYCFDDIGVEAVGRHYGKDCNVVGEILLSRYDLFLKHKIKTHATTNLNAQELEERYGNRVRSRMRQLFSLIAFGEESEDKRK